VAEVLDIIGSGEVPRMTLMNKIDLVDEGGRRRLAALHPDAVQVSAKTGEGLDELLDAVARFFAAAP